MKKVNEIFYSLQGEGFHTGTPAVFIRFSGCNLKCPFCDTNHHDGTLMSDDQIVNEVTKHNTSLIILTGGEPSLQIDAQFVDMLKAATGATIAIETNGTHTLPKNIDWITLSPKIGIADHDLPIVITHADEIKVVNVGQPLEPYFKLSCRHSETKMFLQPCHVSSEEKNQENVANTVKRVLNDPRWRLSLQTHILLGIQ